MKPLTSAQIEAVIPALSVGSSISITFRNEKSAGLVTMKGSVVSIEPDKRGCFVQYPQNPLQLYKLPPPEHFEVYDVQVQGESAVGNKSPAPQEHQASPLVEKIMNHSKANEWRETLASFEELQCLPDLESYPNFDRLVKAWGRALTAAEKIGSDHDHLIEMVEEFEARFERHSEYLHAMLLDRGDPVPAVAALIARGECSVDALEGIFDRYRRPEDFSKIREIWSYFSMHKIPVTPEIKQSFLRLYSVQMKHEDAEALYDEMKANDLDPWCTMILNMLINTPSLKRPRLSYYTEFLDHNVKPDMGTFRLMQKYAQKDELAMWRRRVKNETAPEERYLDQLKQFSADRPDYAAALRLYKRMLLEGMEPDRYVFNCMILCCKETPQEAEVWYQQMLQRGIEPNAQTFLNLITVCRDANGAEQADKWLNEMKARGITEDSHIYATLLDALVKSGQRYRAQTYFRQLIESGQCGVVIYNTMMRLGPFDWAFGCLALMLSEGLQPTTHTRSTMQSLAKDPTSHSMLTAIANCSWSKELILQNDELVSKGTANSTPTLLDCMRFILRELKVSDRLLQQRCDMLRAEAARCKVPPPP